MHRLAQRAPPPAPRAPALASHPPSLTRSLALAFSRAQHHYFLCFLAFLLASVLYVGGACVYAATVGLTRMGGLSGATRGATYTPAAYKAAAAAASGGDANATGLGCSRTCLERRDRAARRGGGLELLLAYRRLSAGDAFGDLEAEFLLLVVCVPTALFAGTLLYIQTKNLLAGLTYIESCRRVPPAEYNNGWRQRPGRLRRRRRRAPRARAPRPAPARRRRLRVPVSGGGAPRVDARYIRVGYRG